MTRRSPPLLHPNPQTPTGVLALGLREAQPQPLQRDPPPLSNNQMIQQFDVEQLSGAG